MQSVYKSRNYKHCKTLFLNICYENRNAFTSQTICYEDGDTRAVSSKITLVPNCGLCVTEYDEIVSLNSNNQVRSAAHTNLLLRTYHSTKPSDTCSTHIH
jgi:hypothetical protein